MRPHRLRLASALILAGGPAGAAVNPCALDEMVAAAPVAVQVTDVSVDEGPQGPMGLHCEVSGVVARSFRGGLAVGEAVEALVPCRPLPDGMAGELRPTDPRALRGAGTVELHLDADRVAAAYGAGVAVLEAPTEALAYEPLCPAP